jgi:hypothetical protein
MVLLNPGAVFGHQFNYIQFFLRLRVPLAMAAIVFAILGLGANFLGIEIAIRGEVTLRPRIRLPHCV